ncbi:ABC transporter permease [uncultured Muribaculum sp.]|uniref:ABC transporter permease n=2 Tax=uncultured Muribaculum sp. TaxID=1918613 RepID=UPI0025AFCB5B|nr:ABC transporter permease [uncultured Muribaculum sp.]
MNKSRFLLIMQREYYSIVAKKSFIVSTLLVPLLVLCIGVVPVVLSELSSADVRQVAVVDETGRYGKELKGNDEFQFSIAGHQESDSRNLRQKFNSDSTGLYAIVVIPANVETTNQVSVYSEKTIQPSLTRLLEEDLDRALSEAKIASYNIPELDKIVKESQVEVTVKGYTWSDDDEEQTSSTEIAMVVGIALSFLTYMFVLMYGAMIMSSVVEDKTNRIVEVIVSSCRPMELMLGKVVGVALVGLTQILIWAVLLGAGLVVISLSGLAAAPAPAELVAPGMPGQAMPSGEFAEIMQGLLAVNWFQILGVFVLYFIGGYLLYSALFAGFGSAVDQQSDASQFMTPVMLIIVFALMIGQACMESPDSTLGVVCSYVPFTSPIVMMVRLPYDVPFWEVALSILLLYATAGVCIWLAARIYRRGILMYGHKASYKDLLRWLR